MLDQILTLLGRKKDEQLVSIDIGTSTIKVMELDMRGRRPKLIGAGMAPTPAQAISNNMVTRLEPVATAIRSIMEANDMQSTKAIIALPGPSAFSKKISIGKTSLKELNANITFEASNYIPHQIDAVHLDYLVTSSGEGSAMDVLLVAVKNEIIDSYRRAVEEAGLEAAIADIDFYALENMFEINYPELHDKTVALVNIGSRYTTISILQDGTSLFNGDVGVGGRLYTDALCESLNMQAKDAERVKTGDIPEGYDAELIAEILDRTTEHVASELHRQLGFFWNAAATDRAIDAIYVCGGGAQTRGLLDELSAKTGMACQLVDTFRGVDCTDSFDSDYLDEIAPSMAISVGLATRRFGDKIQAIE